MIDCRDLRSRLKTPNGIRAAAIAVAGVAFSRHISVNMALSGAWPTSISRALGARREF